MILVHGMSASLHDWDELVPELVQGGHSAHALDLLGHGESAKPGSRFYQVEWLFEHMAAWIDSLALTGPAVLVGHSLGGYLVLEYARRFPSKVRALVLVDPFYRHEQLPAWLRLYYRQASFNMSLIERLPGWMLRMVIDVSSLSLGHGPGVYFLPEHVRAQTVQDFKRTAAGVYNIPNNMDDLTPYLGEIRQPSLLIWGTRDTTLSPASFLELEAALPQVEAHRLSAGHVPHQSNASEFNRLVLDFLRELVPAN